MPALPSSRLVSLDVFRGFTVALMLLVNNPGDWGHIYTPLAHAEWHGCTLADLVFPFFLFIVGVSITYALSKAKGESSSHLKPLGRVWRRAAVLAGLGLLASTWLDFDLATLRIPGVLVRIGLVYGLSATVFLLTNWRIQLALIVLLLAGYAVLLQVLPVPGSGPANLEPATNLGAWLDRLVFGEAHLWKESRTWDPEGLLGTLPALATGLLGVLAGQWLRGPASTPPVRTAGLLAAGLVLAAAGLGWNHWFPINKSLWTSSYVLFTAGMAALVLAVLYWQCDVRQLRWWTGPWRALGVNALAAFFGSSVVARTLNRVHIGQLGVKDFLYQHYIAPWFAAPRTASLAGAVACLLIWWVVLGLLYRRGWVWRA
jgi:predicted acyltransferase